MCPRPVGLWQFVDFVWDGLVDICWERADLLASRLCCFTLCRLDFCVPFPYGVWGRKWNSIYRFLIIAFSSTSHLFFSFPYSYYQRSTWLILSHKGCCHVYTYIRTTSHGGWFSITDTMSVLSAPLLVLKDSRSVDTSSNFFLPF